MKNKINKNIQKSRAYISKAKENGIGNKLVIEKIDNTPESQLIQNIMIRMAEYYNGNKKSKKSSSLKGKA